ncbi:MAG: hypothetical protein CMF49_02670 [Legionellales bacterium]|nr:hypothetical protein [Legionellales bacterium]|tara:strand:+ start:229 stop:450 length:222 start_codon:yes stop_codon:yes gene_type:complete
MKVSNLEIMLKPDTPKHTWFFEEALINHLGDFVEVISIKSDCLPKTFRFNTSIIHAITFDNLINYEQISDKPF